MAVNAHPHELSGPPIAAEVPGIVERLCARFPWVAREDVEAAVAAEVCRLEPAPLREFLAVFVERGAAGILSHPSTGAQR